MAKRLEDKVIVITGGTKGVGSAFALHAAKEGARLVIGGRDQASAEKVMQAIEAAGAEGIFVPMDLQKVDDCKRLFDEGAKRFGRIDGFFSYAGATPISPLDTCDEKTFDMVTNINYKAAFFCCQRALHYMRQNKGGSIVLTGSAHGWGGQKDRAAYAMTKGVLRILMEHIAHNYAADHIRCNYLAIGWTATEGEISLRASQGESEEELRARAAEAIPMGRMCEVDDYLETLTLLMSSESEIMTGSTLRMTAGEYL